MGFWEDLIKGQSVTEKFGREANTAVAREREGQEGDILRYSGKTGETRPPNPELLGFGQLDRNDLGALDRFTQGFGYGSSGPFASTLGLAGTAIGGGINELSKAIPGGQEVAGKVAEFVGSDPTQFQSGPGSSDPSFRNFMNLIAGHVMGAGDYWRNKFGSE